MERGKRILISGISGTDIKSSLVKLRKYCSEKGIQLEPELCINAKMHEIARKRTHQDISWFEVLSLPNPVLKDFWHEAMSEIIQEVQRMPEANYILVSHSCYFHQFTQEFISYLCIQDIKSFAPDSVITVIDDVDDIHLRLKKEGGIFSSEYGGASFHDIENVLELKKILDWRTKEIVLSRFLSSAIEVPHFLLAIKHPVVTLYSLIFENDAKYRIYLSHPISKIREQLFAKKVVKAREEMEPITSLSRLISTHAIGFFPTTIDEFRLRVENNGTVKYSERWEESIYQNGTDTILFTPNPETKHLPYSEEALKPYYQKKNGKSKRQTELKRSQLQFIVDSFLKELNSQVGIRDKILVEQSHALFVYRPYLKGRISTGVQTEIEYIQKIRPNDSKKLGIVYFPKDDYDDVKLYQTKEGIKQLIKYDLRNDGTLLFTINRNRLQELDNQLDVILRKKIVSSFGDSSKMLTLVREIIRSLIKDAIIVKNPHYKDKALDPQRASQLEPIYLLFIDKLITSYNNQIKQLEDRFVIYSDPNNVESVLQEYLESIKN
jgi:hypothetical protein